MKVCRSSNVLWWTIKPNQWSEQPSLLFIFAPNDSKSELGQFKRDKSDFPLYSNAAIVEVFVALSLRERVFCLRLFPAAETDSFVGTARQSLVWFANFNSEPNYHPFNRE